MPAYEVREHLQTHGYDVVGRYPSTDAARDKINALVAEDRYRLGRYTIDYVQQAVPDEAAIHEEINARLLKMGKQAVDDAVHAHFDVGTEAPGIIKTQEEPDMGLMRTSGHRPAKPAGLPTNSAADMVEPDSDTPVHGSTTTGAASTAADAVDGARGKEPTVSEAARAAGAKKP